MSQPPNSDERTEPKKDRPVHGITTRTLVHGEAIANALDLSSIDVEALRSALAEGLRPTSDTKMAAAAPPTDLSAAEQRGFEQGLIESEQRGRAAGTPSASRARSPH